MKRRPTLPDGRNDPAGWAGWACLAMAGCLLLSLSIQKIWAADIWWQIRTGEWILDHRSVPFHDLFSYTVPGHEWVEMRWLFCVFAYLLWQAGGPSLLILVQTALLTAAFAAVALPVVRTATTPAGLLILVLGVGSAASRFVPRPELVSYLFIALYLLALQGYVRGRYRRTVWGLPLVQVIWTNAHSLFVYGPVLAWLFVAGEVLFRLTGRGSPRTSPGRAPAAERPRPMKAEPRSLAASPRARLALLAAAVTAACFLNPYGLRGALFPFTLFREIQKGSFLGGAIKEFISPFALERWSWDLYVAALFVLVAALTFAVNWRRTDPARLMIWAAFVYLAGVSTRNVAPLALVTTWAGLWNLEEIRLSAASPAARAGRTRSPAWQIGLAAALVFACWYVVSDRFYVRMGAPRRFGLGVVEWHTAAAATRFTLEAGARPQVFHSLGDGSYLTWAAKDRYPVYIDGRLEVYGEQFVERYHGLADHDLLGHLDEEGVNTLILERDYFNAVLPLIAASPKWVLVHIDPRDLVFVRDTPEHADLIRRYRIDPKQPWAPRGPEPEERPAGWRRWIGSVEQPWYSYSMAKNFLALRSPGNAERFLVRGLERFPDHAGMKQLLEKLRRGRAG